MFFHYLLRDFGLLLGVNGVLSLLCDLSHLSMEDNQLEEGVHQQDSIWQDAAAVQENRL